ncbi:hypothetical protein BGX34_012141 [Mortierella sp. NVP85]|nr:hypothetical protein BGX34_012141 [Mortierella sp. NVP85]
MTSHKDASWPPHDQPNPHSSPASDSFGSRDHPHPHTAPYPHPHPTPYYPHPPPPPPGHHSTSPPPPHSYYPYHSYAPGPYPYPHPPPPGHPHGYGHAQPGYSQHPSNSKSPSNGSETASAASLGDQQPKTEAKPAAKAKSEASKASSAPKTPKTFRFEGSISSETFKTTKSFDLAGVNILNRKPLDTKTALDKLQRRRETHNRVERKRRDCINQLIDELTKLLPPKHLEEATSKCHRVNVLRGAVSHIKFLNESNEALKKSVQAIQGDDAPFPTPVQGEKKGKDMSMDVDEDKDEMDEDGASDQDEDSSSRSTSPAESSRSVPTTKKMPPPPVIITDAAPPTDRDQARKASEADSFSLESRPRSNSFASSVGDLGSPPSAPSGSPMFPPSPMSPLPHQRQGAFPPGEDHVEGDYQRQQLSPRHSHSTSTSPALPPISSLANLHLQSPPGPAGEGQPLSSLGSSAGQGRSHRGNATLPPLMIPEPHHLHPSYQQGAGNSGTRSGTSSNRTSLTLSPHSAEHPPISPFMLSPMLSRSPSMGPASSSTPGSSPYPHWGHEGPSSPQPYPPYGYPYGYHGYPHPGQGDAGHTSPYMQPQKQATSPLVQNKPRPKSLQPEPIFIQEEPWNIQRKRSVSGKTSKASAQDKKKVEAAAETSRPTSPASSITSNTSYPTSPNPKKRAQLARYDEGDDTEADNKRSKQAAQARDDGSHQRDSGVVVVVEPSRSQSKNNQNDEDAAQALTSLAQAIA